MLRPSNPAGDLIRLFGVHLANVAATAVGLLTAFALAQMGLVALRLAQAQGRPTGTPVTLLAGAAMLAVVTLACFAHSLAHARRAGRHIA